MKTTAGVHEPEEPGMSAESYRALYTELMRRIIWTVSSPIRWVSKR